MTESLTDLFFSTLDMFYLDPLLGKYGNLVIDNLE